MTEPRKRKKSFALTNKNLCTRPLARDSRVKANWKFSEKHQHWWCDLPGTFYIRYRLPAEAERRLPDGFDVAVMLLLLSEARMKKSRYAKFDSQGDMLRLLGVPVRAYYRQRLNQSLTLWSQLSIRWKKWFIEAKFVPFAQQPYKGRTAQKGRYVARVSPPPIQRLRRKPPKFEIAKQWLEQHLDHEAKVYYPLPRRAVVQNLVLVLLAIPDAEPRSLRSWCRMVGLNHTTRNRQLLRIVHEVDQWFQQHKGKYVQIMQRNDQYWFIQMPKLPGTGTHEGRDRDAEGKGQELMIS